MRIRLESLISLTLLLSTLVVASTAFASFDAPIEAPARSGAFAACVK